eukprot:5857198-Amphidinium_carterae.1
MQGFLRGMPQKAMLGTVSSGVFSEGARRSKMCSWQICRSECQGKEFPGLPKTHTYPILGA